MGKEILSEIFPHIKKENIPRRKQDQKLFLEYWPKRTPEDGKIDWNKSAKEIHRLIRASTKPYPGAFTFYKNKKIIIWKAGFSQEEIMVPGEILKNEKFIDIGTKKGVIIIKEYSINNNDKLKEFFKIGEKMI